MPEAEPSYQEERQALVKDENLSSSRKVTLVLTNSYLNNQRDECLRNISKVFV